MAFLSLYASSIGCGGDPAAMAAHRQSLYGTFSDSSGGNRGMSPISNLSTERQTEGKRGRDVMGTFGRRKPGTRAHWSAIGHDDAERY